MNTNNLSLNHQTPSFGALRTEKMSKHCKNIVQEKILPYINEKLVNDLDNMGYDIVFQKGYGIEGKAFEIFLHDKEQNFSRWVEEIQFKKDLEDFIQKQLKKLSNTILKAFIAMNK